MSKDDSKVKKKTKENVFGFSVVFVFFGVLMLIAFISGKYRKAEKKQNEIAFVAKIERIVETKKYTTRGNNTYVPINKSGDPADYFKLILNLVYDFEIENLGLKVKHWHIEKQQQAHTTQAYIEGIWIKHEARNKLPTP